MSHERGTKTRFRTALPALLVALCVTTAPARAEDRAAAYQKAVGGVVCVLSLGPNGECSTGTGVVTAVGIVTAKHVIQPGNQVAVLRPARDKTGAIIGNLSHYAADARHIKLCAVVGASAERDLALLRLAEPEKCDVIPLAATGASPGDHVFTIGASAGSAMWHYVSGSARQVYQGGFTTEGGAEVRGKIIELTAPLNPGDSGGPILNKEGKLVGINLATVPTRNQVHMGIDVSEVRAFLIERLEAESRELREALK